MIDLFGVLDIPGVDVKYFQGTTDVTLLRWQTWHKPRGCQWIYMFGVGGGSSGGSGINTAGTSGGGAGGGSGAQSSLLIPSFMVPDQLYVQAGMGGKQAAAPASGAVGVAGIPTYIAAEPFTTLNASLTYLIANNGQATGAAATATTGGAAGTAAVVGSLATMPLAARGFSTFLVGQAGTAGGTNAAAGTGLTYPVTGLLVSGGAGGGGGNGATASAGGAANQATAGLGTAFYQNLTGGAAASGATPAGRGLDGYTGLLGHRWGASGGGGATTTAGGNAGAGGNGAPGCGGGGAGGPNTTNTTVARGGDGGDGFVIIAAFN